MLTAIIIPFLLAVISLLLGGLIVGGWVMYRKFVKSEDCTNILKEIILTLHDNKELIKNS